MKYAILGPQKGVNRIAETEPQNLPEGSTFEQITNEQAAQVEAGRTSTPRVLYFLIDGELQTMQQKMEAQRQARLAERAASMTPAEKIKEAEKHVLRRFTPIGVSALQDKLLEKKEAGELANYPKLVAVYTWMKTIQGMALAGDVNFPDSPHTFDEVLAE